MEELKKLLNINLCPKTQGKTFIKLKCYCDFEGHGRASETWEEHWLLTLPQVPAHYKVISGWRKCKGLLPMNFHGRTYDDVVNQAKTFLKEMP